MVPYQCHAGPSASNLSLGMFIVRRKAMVLACMILSFLFFIIPTFGDLFLVYHLELNSELSGCVVYTCQEI